MYVVIMAGGGGTRLWPLSRPERPKPFLPLIGERTLFQRTVDRARALVDDPDDIYCVTDHKYGHFVQQQAPDIRLLAEPAGRNTAAAIALATAAIDRPSSDVMLVLPADHWIEHEPEFLGVLRDAAAELAAGAPDLGLARPLVTLGIQVDRPSTEYGYLLPDMDHRQRRTLTAYLLKAFVEKPDLAHAEQLRNTEGVAWNAGIFLWQREAIREALEKYTSLPMLLDSALGSELALRNAYDRVTPISIDKAVMEGAASDHRVVMAGMDVGWSDLGSWTALLAAMAGDRTDGATGRVVQTGETIHVGPDDLVVHPDGGHLVAQPGLSLGAGPDGTIVADGVWAHLAGARHLEPDVQALLDRVDQSEVRA